MTSQRVGRLVSRLSARRPSEGVFNPWAEVDVENDLGPQCPGIRREQLAHYLDSRLGQARYLLVGEALGYQGGHFSGIAMTSERILLGGQRGRGIHPKDVLTGMEPRRTSHPTLKPAGFTEPTATIVWEALLDAGLEGTDFALWNAFPWHPFDPSRGMLSNRRLRRGELNAGADVMRSFLALFPRARPISVGMISAGLLAGLGVQAHAVRHPAQGGAAAFRAQIGKLFG